MAFINKIKNIFRIIQVEVLIYGSTEDVFQLDSTIEYDIKKSYFKKKGNYLITDGEVVVHKSFLYKNVRVLQLIGKSGLVIGSCYTNPIYRGRGIYPKIIIYITKDNKNKGEIFMVVDHQNYSSIKGIEKAGYRRIAYIKAKKWTLFYFDKTIKRLDN